MDSNRLVAYRRPVIEKPRNSPRLRMGNSAAVSLNRRQQMFEMRKSDWLLSGGLTGGFFVVFYRPKLGVF